MDCSPPSSSVHGILQARIPEWVAMPSSRWSSQARDRNQVSCIASGLFTVWAIREAQKVQLVSIYFLLLSASLPGWLLAFLQEVTWGSMLLLSCNTTTFHVRTLRSWCLSASIHRGGERSSEAPTWAVWAGQPWMWCPSFPHPLHQLGLCHVTPSLKEGGNVDVCPSSRERGLGALWAPISVTGMVNTRVQPTLKGWEWLAGVNCGGGFWDLVHALKERIWRTTLCALGIEGGDSGNAYVTTCGPWF